MEIECRNHKLRLWTCTNGTIIYTAMPSKFNAVHTWILIVNTTHVANTRSQWSKYMNKIKHLCRLSTIINSSNLLYRKLSYYTIIDRLHSELKIKPLYYDEANEKFNFLFQITKLTPSEIYKKRKYYKTCTKVIFFTCIQFRSHLMNLSENKQHKSNDGWYNCKYVIRYFVRVKSLG